MCASPAWLIVGLGNPGDAYRETRHNLGFWTVEQVAVRAGVTVWMHGAMMDQATARLWDTPVALVKPLRWMNLSGGVVRSALSSWDVPTDRLVVVCDDVALPDGRIRIRTGGSSGGHKGLASVVEALGINEFVRMRIGVGSCRTEEDDLSDFVLRPLTADERTRYVRACCCAAEILESCVQRGFFTSMTADTIPMKPLPDRVDSPSGPGLT